jgi:hypothetical protein
VSNGHVLALLVGAVELLNGGVGVLGGKELDEAEATRLLYVELAVLTGLPPVRRTGVWVDHDLSLVDLHVVSQDQELAGNIGSLCRP